jgi:xanthine dehydrogenase accessory factor
MNDNEYMVNTLCNLLEKSTALVLASIVNLQGSSPRHEGTKMIIDANGKIYGTIGGSLLEADAIGRAKSVILQRQSSFMTFELNGTDVRSLDMICGGKTLIFLNYISPAKENLEFFLKFKDSLRNNEVFHFVTIFDNKNDAVNILNHSLYYQDGRIINRINTNDRIHEAVKRELPAIAATAVLQLSGCGAVIDPVKKAKTLYCFGGGHVALPTAHIAAMVGFRVVVIDDREEFASRDRFPEASEIIVTDDFNTVVDKLPIDEDSFIVILTRGHQFDREVLQQA